jgi:hypothetical protein
MVRALRDHLWNENCIPSNPTTSRFPDLTPYRPRQDVAASFGAADASHRHKRILPVGARN